MRPAINTRPRKLANRCLVAIGLSSTLPSFVLAAPVDQLLPANAALIEPAEKSSRDSRVEVSVLKSPAKSETLSTGDLPSILEAVPGQREPKKTVYDNGRIVQPKTNWYERGKKRSEETLLTPAANRLVAHDWWASKVVFEPLPDAIAVRQGLYTAWHPNGQKRIEGNFSSGAPSGEFQRWYANGQLQSKGYFQEGAALGEWFFYHPNGMKMMEGSYENAPTTRVASV